MIAISLDHSAERLIFSSSSTAFPRPAMPARTERARKFQGGAHPSCHDRRTRSRQARRFHSFFLSTNATGLVCSRIVLTSQFRGARFRFGQLMESTSCDIREDTERRRFFPLVIPSSQRCPLCRTPDSIPHPERFK